MSKKVRWEGHLPNSGTVLRQLTRLPSETSFREGPPNTVVLNFLLLAFSQKIKIVFRLENKQRDQKCKGKEEISQKTRKPLKKYQNSYKSDKRLHLCKQGLL